MNRTIPRLSLLLIVCLLPVSLFAQGQIAPTGTPGPTMKSLDQIEPRTPISSLPFTISAPGSYYFTKNLTASGNGAGITVSADNVTIDLNGFALVGGGSGTVAGITVPAAQQSLCVRNGTVNGWTAGGISAAGASASLYEKLRLYNNSSSVSTDGALQTGLGATIKDCNLLNNGAPYTIKGGTATTVVNCTVVLSSATCGIYVGSSSTVIGSSLINNNAAGGQGIYALDYSTVTQCTAYQFADGIQVTNFGTITHCTAGGCTDTGFFSGRGTKVSDCTADNNVGGILLGTSGSVSHCTVSGNSAAQISVSDGSTVTDCLITNGSSTGILLTNGSTVRGCTSRGNAGSGILANSGNFIEGNTCDANNTAVGSSSAGIYVTGQANRIDNNNITSNSFAGLQVKAGGNIIIRNTFSGAEYIVVSGNTIGPLVDMASGGTIASTSPWANFHYN